MLYNNSSENSSYLHQYYMSIINSIPDVVYWVDLDCNLMGCNRRFIQLMGLSELKELKGKPYQQMLKAHWNEQRVEELKLDDMQVLFSKQPIYNKEETPVKGKADNCYYFLSTRVPMIDENKHVVGLIVVLTERIVREHSAPSTIKNKKIKKTDLVRTVPTVLMIEDNVITQNVEKALLTALNCHVDVADSGEQALKLFNPGKYDLVLMDIGLQDTSGYVVAKQLRHMEKNTKHRVPIIALTSYAADVVKYDCEQYFMEGAITKPLTNEQARELINHYFHHTDTPVPGLKHT